MLQFIAVPSLIVVICFIVLSVVVISYYHIDFNQRRKQQIVNGAIEKLNNIKKNNIYLTLGCSYNNTNEEVEELIKSYITDQLTQFALLNDNNDNNDNNDKNNGNNNFDTDKYYMDIKNKFNAFDTFIHMDEHQRKLYNDVLNGNIDEQLKYVTDVNVWETLYIDLCEIKIH